MDAKFLLENGKLTVMSSGIYFVYAQVGYFDWVSYSFPFLDQLS